MKYSWKDVCRLLDGSTLSGSIACDALLDIVTESDISEVVHVLCTSYATHNNVNARLSVAKVLRELCVKYQSTLIPLLESGESDGVILSRHDIDISHIVSNGVELYGDSGKSETDGDLIYGSQWVKQQRSALRRRLGKETASRDAAVSVRYMRVKDLLGSKDVTITPQDSENSAYSSENNGSGNLELRDNESNESWFVRLLRFMVSGLLADSWVSRHGRCHSLVGVLEGLSLMNPNPEDSPRIPPFLAEDILATGLSVLLLDRFMDVAGESDDAGHTTNTPLYSPVKEAAAELVAVVCATFAHHETGDIEATEIALRSALEMCSYESIWTVRHSGLLLLKHLLGRGVESLRTAALVDDVFGALSKAIAQETNDDIRGAALDAVCSLNRREEYIASCASWSDADRVIHSRIPLLLSALNTSVPNITSLSANTVIPLTAEAIRVCVRVYIGGFSAGDIDSVLHGALLSSGDLLSRIQALHCDCHGLPSSITWVNGTFHSILQVMNNIRINGIQLLSAQSSENASRRFFLATARILCKIISLAVVVGDCGLVAMPTDSTVDVSIELKDDGIRDDFMDGAELKRLPDNTNLIMDAVALMRELHSRCVGVVQLNHSVEEEVAINIIRTFVSCRLIDHANENLCIKENIALRDKEEVCEEPKKKRRRKKSKPEKYCDDCDSSGPVLQSLRDGGATVTSTTLEAYCSDSTGGIQYSSNTCDTNIKADWCSLAPANGGVYLALLCGQIVSCSFDRTGRGVFFRDSFVINSIYVIAMDVYNRMEKLLNVSSPTETKCEAGPVFYFASSFEPEPPSSANVHRHVCEAALWVAWISVYISHGLVDLNPSFQKGKEFLNHLKPLATTVKNLRIKLTEITVAHNSCDIVKKYNLAESIMEGLMQIDCNINSDRFVVLMELPLDATPLEQHFYAHILVDIMLFSVAAVSDNSTLPTDTDIMNPAMDDDINDLDAIEDIDEVMLEVCASSAELNKGFEQCLLKILSEGVQAAEKCALCWKTFVRDSIHGGVDEGSKCSSPRRYGELLLTLLSTRLQTQALELFPCALAELRLNSHIQGEFHGNVSRIRFLTFVLPSIPASDMRTMLNEGLLGKVVEMVAACLVATAPTCDSSQTKVLLPQYDEIHRNDDIDDVCKCKTPHAHMAVYSSQILESSISILRALCKDKPELVSNSYFVLTTFPAIVLKYLETTNVNVERTVAVTLYFLAAVSDFRERLLCGYEVWFQVALNGVGHHSCQLTRRLFGKALRMLVPLAPLLRRPATWDRPTSTVDYGNDVDEKVATLVHGVLCVASGNALSSESCNAPAVKGIDRLIEGLKALYDDENGAAYDQKLNMCLRPYQVKGINWILQLWSCGLSGILADEMGLGKTVQTLASIALARSGRVSGLPSFVVCPALLVPHWIAETKKFVPHNVLEPLDLAAEVSHSLKELKRRESFNKSEKYSAILTEAEVHKKTLDYLTCVAEVLSTLKPQHLLVSSYDIVRKIFRHSMDMKSIGLLKESKSLHSYLFGVVVADEAHCLRNPKTDVCASMFALQAVHRIALTGTPVQNRIEDIWSLMNFIIPEFLGDYKEFSSSTLKPILKAFLDKECEIFALPSDIKDSNSNKSAAYEKQIEISAEGMRLLRLLHKQVSPFILRRTKDVALPDLPPKMVLDLFCPLSKHQRLLYASFQGGLSISDSELERELEDYIKRSTGGGVQQLSSIPQPPPYSLDKKGSVWHPFKALSYLKRICVHPSLVEETSGNSVDDIAASGKLCALVRLLIEQDVVRDSTGVLDYVERVWSGIAGDDASTHERREHVYDSDSERSVYESDSCSEDNEGNSGDSSSDTNEEGDGEEEKFNEQSGLSSIHDADNIDDIPSKKCLIFAEHRATLDIIERYVFTKYFPAERILRLDGRVSANQRARLANDFNTPGSTSPRILLLTTASCGLGLNLSAAEMVVFVEHSWNPFVDLQAMDRVHRIGQVKAVSVYRLLAESTIESRINFLQSFKSVVADQIVIGDKQWDSDEKAVGMSSEFTLQEAIMDSLRS